MLHRGLEAIGKLGCFDPRCVHPWDFASLERVELDPLNSANEL